MIGPNSLKYVSNSLALALFGHQAFDLLAGVATIVGNSPDPGLPSAIRTAT
jgi:hypothetical protein